jgi:nucleoid-associated protein YgaU
MHGDFRRWTRKEAKPDFANVRSGGSSTAPAPERQADGDSSPAGSVHTYVVVKGDSLSKIAGREYGDPQKWRRIYDANRDLIKDPDLIYPRPATADSGMSSRKARLSAFVVILAALALLG